jgi:hypothetical protein
VREFFLLQRAERTIASYSPGQHALVVEQRAAGKERLRAARAATSQVAACLLLKDAVAALARSRAASLDPALDVGVARPDLPQLVPDLPPDPLDGRRGDAERVKEVFTSADPLYFDHAPPDERVRTRAALERAAAALSRTVEARSRLHVRALRWARLGAILVVLAYAAWVLASHRAGRSVNLATGKPVHASSLAQNPPDGHELVDGHPGFTFGVQTNKEESPSVVIDLLADYPIDTVKVYNRADGWYGDCLPLVLEFSKDGKTYTEVAQRTDFFDFQTPWVVDAGERWARYVRLRVAHRGYLTLGLVEVFGKKP